MPPHPTLLLNAAEVELWPAWLLRARSNAHARLLARGRWLLRRKHDGRYLAVLDGQGNIAVLDRTALRAPLLKAGLELARRGSGNGNHAVSQPGRPPLALPLHGLQARLQALGLDADAYAQRTALALVAEPDWLALAGFDRYRRALWLHPGAARAWRQMQAAARADGVAMDAISGYRSHDYQLGIFRRKLARGQSIAQILEVNAAPGFSEHHGGQALDIGAPGTPPAEACFEHSPAHEWLQAHAGDHGFVMSYPRDNPHGIVHEPWHWAWRG